MTRRQRSATRGRRRYAVAPGYVVTLTLAVLLTAGLALLLGTRLGLTPLPAYLLAVNTTTLLAYAYDKGVAGNARRTRIPERVLHLLGLAGGTPAALLGQAAFRHKTQKGSFRVWFWVIACVQIAAIGAWWWMLPR